MLLYVYIYIYIDDKILIKYIFGSRNIAMGDGEYDLIFVVL